MAEISVETATVESRLAQALQAAGKLDAASAERMRRACALSSDRYDRILIQLGLVSERDVAMAFAAVLDLPLVEPDAYPETPLFEERIRPSFLKAHRILPLSVEGARAREAPAYEAQQRFLRVFGRNVVDEFHLDRMALKLMTSCLFL
jgi:hypothetical protein